MAHERRTPVTSRIGSSLLAVGAGVTAATIVAPHSPQLNVAGFWALFGVQLAIAGLLRLLPRGCGVRVVPPLVVATGIAAVTAALALNGERLGGAASMNELFYVWPALYVGYFFSPRGIVAALAGIAAAYAWVLGYAGIGGQAALTRWLIVVAVVTGSAALLRSLRRQVDGLLTQLRDAASTDALTGLMNRRGFGERFAQELARAGRTGQPLSLVLGDIDRFKGVNDRFGHASGDRALARVAAVLRAGSRVTDVPARVGGEEFALLLPDTDAAGAFVVAERLRAAVSGVTDEAGRALTMSFGIATSPDHGSDPDALMRIADAALYAAKGQGRDRTVAHALAA